MKHKCSSKRTKYVDITGRGRSK